MKTQRIHCPGLDVAQPWNLGGGPLWACPQGHIPDTARAGGEVIRGIFHTDRTRAGMAPGRTLKGRKEAVTEPDCAKPWLHTQQLSTSSPRPGRKRMVKGMVFKSDRTMFRSQLYHLAAECLWTGHGLLRV